MFAPLITFIQDQFATQACIALHAPCFVGHEQAYVKETLDTAMVSSIGPQVVQLEQAVARYTGSTYAIATVSGTSALHIALLLAGVERGDLVITQPLCFVATCNAVAYCGAEPIFVDVNRQTLGLCPQALDAWLQAHAERDDDGVCRTRQDRRVIRACVPMHTFGHPVQLDELAQVCSRWGVILVEDAAESLGSTYHGRHAGTVGTLSAISFNGNKIITTGGGGMVLTSDRALGERAKHLTTTAKRPHAYEFWHDEVGYNYRMPNLNAALGCAQLEQLEKFVQAKRQLAQRYQAFFKDSEITCVQEPPGCRSNYWLNAVICVDQAQRDDLLKTTHANHIMTRPVWTPLHHLPMYAHCPQAELPNAQWLAQRLVNLPSSVLPKWL